MQARWLFTAAMVVVSVGCTDEYSGNYGEIQKIQNGNREYLLIWERCGNNNRLLCVKVSYKVSGLVKREFTVAAWDDYKMPRLKMHLDESNNQITIIAPEGIVFERQCE